MHGAYGAERYQTQRLANTHSALFSPVNPFSSQTYLGLSMCDITIKAILVGLKQESNHFVYIYTQGVGIHSNVKWGSGVAIILCRSTPKVLVYTAA